MEVYCCGYMGQNINLTQGELLEVFNQFDHLISSKNILSYICPITKQMTVGNVNFQLPRRDLSELIREINHSAAPRDKPDAIFATDGYRIITFLTIIAKWIIECFL